VRLLGIETSTPRGSIALIEDERIVCLLEHAEPSAHAERILPLIARGLEQAGWSRGELQRIAVGIGPGSFVGLRVGIALAQGLGLGLGIPVIGVSSLRSLAAVVPPAYEGPRIALLDARREELFAAVYAADGRELLAPDAVPRAQAGALVARFANDAVIVGEVAQSLDLSADRVWRGERAFPSADRTALLARALDPAEAPPLPLYCRGPGATLPDLPPSPFGFEA
jgi:tRNA threonylcarbamoyladenosine biosynthesis protein TsaB